MLKPGFFGESVAADTKRTDFDFGNEQVLFLNKKVDFLFIGDSITMLWDLHLYFDSKNVLINRGIGGDWSKYVLKRFDADCVQLKPKYAIMMIGTNDISRSEDDLWWHNKGMDENEVLEEYKSNINEIIKKCDGNGIELVLCSVPPSTIAPPYNRERRWRMTDAMNEFLKSTGKKYINYFDSLTNDGKNIISEYSLDGIHPNAKAYQIMADILKKEIDI